jgi:extracellular solute-binding protein
MRLTLFGKLVVLLVFLSILYYAWTHLLPAGTKEQIARLRERLPGQTHQGSSGRSGNGQGGVVRAERPGDLLFITTAAKKDWVGLQVEKFNNASENNGRWRVMPRPMPSREAMHAILDGKVEPALWSPGGPMWPGRLAEAWTERHSGGRILDAADPNAYRVFLRSPLVFLTTRDKARFLAPRLGGANPWAALRRLSLGQEKVPWGRFRFSHADPLTSSSGILTLGLILNEFGQNEGDLARVVEGRPFLKYLTELEHALVYDQAAIKGTTQLTKSFLDNPSRYDVITAYESAALEAAPTRPNIAVIYPNPTAFAEHAVCVLQGDWLSDQQREGANRFMEFLSSDQAQADGVKLAFRPARGSRYSLNDRLAQFRAQGFRPSVTSADLPPYQALNSAAYQFRIHIAKQPPTD